MNNYMRLAGCTVESADQPKFSLRIVPRDAKEKPYLLTAQDDATRERWVAALKAAVALREATSVIASGYMVKKGKRRFFVIEDDQLKWYTSSKLGKAEFKGCLQLATCRLSTQPSTHTVILDSTTAAKSYALETSSLDDYRHWLDALGQSIEQAKANWRARHGSGVLLGGAAAGVLGAGAQGAKQRARIGGGTLRSRWQFQIQQTIPVTTAAGKVSCCSFCFFLFIHCGNFNCFKSLSTKNRRLPLIWLKLFRQLEPNKVLF